MCRQWGKNHSAERENRWPWIRRSRVNALLSLSLSPSSLLPHDDCWLILGCFTRELKFEQFLTFRCHFSLSLARFSRCSDDEKFIYFSVVRSRGWNLSMSGMSWDNLFYCAIPSRILFWIILEITKISKCQMPQIESIETWELKFHNFNAHSIAMIIIIIIIMMHKQINLGNWKIKFMFVMLLRMIKKKFFSAGKERKKQMQSRI